MILISLLLCLALCPAGSNAAAETGGDWGTLHWSVSEGELVIDGAGTLIPAAGPWSSYKDEITAIVIGKDIDGLENYAFAEYKKLKKLIIENDAIAQVAYPFEACDSLEEVIIANPRFVFNPIMVLHNESHQLITFPNGSDQYMIEGSMLLSKDRDALVYSLDSGEGELIVPEGVRKIEQYALSKTNYVSVILPDTLEIIDDSAFSECPKLREIIIPRSVRIIESCAFSGCRSLRKVSFLGDDIQFFNPDVPSERYGHFSGCVSLEEICLPKSESVPDMLLKDCSNLKKLIIADGTAELQKDLVEGCKKLTYMYIPASVGKIDKTAVERNLKNLTVYCVPGSYAEGYAKTSGFKYKTIHFVEEIALTESTVQLHKGKAVSIKAQVFPANATEKKTEWVSANPAVATVQNGNVKAISCGECDIICKSTDGSGIQTACHVHVIQPVKSIQLETRSITLLVGAPNQLDQADLGLTIMPEDSTVQTCTFSSSDESVVTVDQYGRIQAMGIGKAIIEVVPEEEKTKVKATCSITVGRAVEKIGLPETATVNINRTIKLKPEIFPQEALSKGVEYSSSDESVVKVAKNGSVKGIASGNAVITCTATDGSGVSASCVITVP